MFTKADLVEFVWSSLSVNAALNSEFESEAFDECGVLLKTGHIGACFDQLV
jgi:hypothetical protein